MEHWINGYTLCFASWDPAVVGLRADIEQASEALDQAWIFRNLARNQHDVEGIFRKI